MVDVLSEDGLKHFGSILENRAAGQCVWQVISEYRNQPVGHGAKDSGGLSGERIGLREEISDGFYDAFHHGQKTTIDATERRTAR
jgi:hypothetical protein